MKKIIAIIIVLVTILSATGCGNTNAQKKPEALAPNHEEYASLAELEVTSMPTAYLSKNGKKYHMGWIYKDEKANVGLSLPNRPKDDFYHLYSEGLTYAPEAEHFHYTISLSELPVPILQEGDKIMAHKGMVGEVLDIMPVELAGYSPLVYRVDDKESYIGEGKNRSINTVKANSSTVKVITVENGKKAAEYNSEEWTKLDYGTEVEVWWETTAGKGYYNKEKAVYAAYTYDPYDRESVKEFKPIGTEKFSVNQYQIFEITGLKPGYYAIVSPIDYDEIHSIFYVSE